MGLLTLHELAGLGNNGTTTTRPPLPPPQSVSLGPVAYSPSPSFAPPPLPTYGQPGGRATQARSYVMPGARPPVASMLAASIGTQAPTSRARVYRATNPDVVAMARAKAAHDRAVQAASLAARRAHAARTRERAKPALTAKEKERLRFAAWQRKVRERNRREAAAAAARAKARREQIAAMEWTAPVSSYPFDLRPVKGESWTEGLKRDWFAFRRGLPKFVSGEETYAKKERDRKRARLGKQRTRDALVQAMASEREYKTYRKVPEAVKQAVFESQASPYIVRDVDRGYSAGRVAFREAYRRYVR